jgi:hypothetical protein
MDRFDIFGGLPDTIEDDWNENIERLEEMMDEYIHVRKEVRDTFELRYKETIDPDKNRWELCSRVLAFWLLRMLSRNFPSLGSVRLSVNRSPFLDRRKIIGHGCGGLKPSCYIIID